MTVLASTGLDITINLLLVVFVLVCLLMSMIILMQRPKNEGLGAAFGSGATDQLFGAQTTNVLQRGTVYLASMFFILTLVLAVLITKRNSSHQSLVGQVAPPAPAVEEPAAPAPDAPKPEDKKLESEVATPPVEAPKPVETPAPAPAPAPAPEAEPKPAEPATPPAEEPKPTEPATPPAEDKQ